MPEAVSWRVALKGAWPFLLAAAVLRLFDFGNMPFTNDELSALSRLNFSSFAALINEGVRPDAHPALVQLFLWAYTAIFGTASWVVRFPFVLAGLASMLVLYRLAYHAFGKPAADLSAAILAASQILIYFSATARPYASGLLICSLMALQWYKIIAMKDRLWSTHLWYGLLIALSVYNHYFSGLLAIIIWLSGFVYYQNLKLKKFLASAAFSFLLFLPHLGVSVDQLGHKGIGSWLRKPAPDFLWEWFLSLFNYDLVALTLLILGAILYYRNPFFHKAEKIGGEKNGGNKIALTFFSWFMLTFAIGYAYSLLVDPLLHHGALLFSTPFFVLSLAYLIVGFTRQPVMKIIPYVVVIALSFSLIFERKHFEVFRMQPYAMVAAQLNGQSSGMAVIAQNPAYMNFYLEQNSTERLGVINLAGESMSNAQILKKIMDSSPPTLYLDGRNWSLTRAATELYGAPKVENGFTYTGYTFTESGKEGTPLYSTLSSGNEPIQSSAEFLELYKIGLDTADFSFGDHAAALIRLSQNDSAATYMATADLHLVIEFSRAGQSLHWSSTEPVNHGFEDAGEWVLTHQMLLWDIFINEREMKGVELKVYLWNPGQLPLQINRWEVNRMEGNPNLYSQLNRRP